MQEDGDRYGETYLMFWAKRERTIGGKGDRRRERIGCERRMQRKIEAREGCIARSRRKTRE